MIDVDMMFFNYCILMQRTSDEFWNARPSQIIFCVKKYGETLNSQNNQVEEVREITSMHEIAGWGCHG